MNQSENAAPIQCSNCGGYYDPALEKCPYCGADPKDNAAPPANAPTVADYAGGFGQPGSAISRVATAIAIGLLLLSVGTILYLGGSIFHKFTGGLQHSGPSSSAEQSSTKEGEEGQNEEESVSVTLDAETLTLAEGESHVLTASVQPDNWEGTLTWTTDQGAILSVDEQGTVTNLSGGDAVVTVSAGTASATCKVHCEGMTLEEKQAAQEQAQKEQEEAERKKAEEEQKRKEEEERKKAEEEQKRKEEEERKKAEEERKRKEEEQRKKAEEERKKEEERKRREEEAAQQSSGKLKLTLYGNTYDDNDFTLVHVGESYDFELSGGNGKYSASSSDSDVAKVSGTKVTATGVGVATVTWTSGGKSVTATIRVNKP